MQKIVDMIPKIIHYCWLGEDEYPPLVKKCIQSWKENLPGWELRLWDKSCIEEINEPWVKEAYQAKVYSHASDYIRLYAVYKYGGFYLDTDVEVIKDFAPLLNLEYVFGFENSDRKYIEAATFGAHAGNVFLYKCMESYHNRHFIKKDGDYDYSFMIPSIMKQNIGNISIINNILDYQSNCPSVQVFTAMFFSPKNCDTSKFDQLTKETFSIHHFRGSWFPLNMKINRFVWKHLSNRQARFIQNIYQKIKSLFFK